MSETDCKEECMTESKPAEQVKKCPCPPECRDKMKKLKRYLHDTKFFLSKCDQCPLAKKMVETAEELLNDFKCPVYN